ncbi:hypothetical protein HPB49_005443 [Dermacentor silvarum]|uniref:Uncharacterized protein n=1 Tax=Dermacentor silvarum TaxID=543639 RepID=A0ACB8DVM2_DERSI|nr:hypothetical protein HPB49_005443 [Dermacentor silvarum]
MNAQRQFGLSGKSVRYWRAQEGKLQKCNPCKTSFRGRSAGHPQIEDTLADIVRELRAPSLSVTSHTIRYKAMGLAREAGLDADSDKRSFFEDSATNETTAPMVGPLIVNGNAYLQEFASPTERHCRAYRLLPIKRVQLSTCRRSPADVQYRSQLCTPHLSAVMDFRLTEPRLSPKQQALLLRAGLILLAAVVILTTVVLVLTRSHRVMPLELRPGAKKSPHRAAQLCNTTSCRLAASLLKASAAC